MRNSRKAGEPEGPARDRVRGLTRRSFAPQRPAARKEFRTAAPRCSKGVSHRNAPLPEKTSQRAIPQQVGVEWPGNHIGEKDGAHTGTKDKIPGEQPRRSILVTLLIAAAIALLAGFLAWGVPSLLKAGAREDEQDTFAVQGFDPQGVGDRVIEEPPQAVSA